MALRKTWAFTPVGLSRPVRVDDAYCRVEELRGGKKGFEIRVAVYESADSNLAALSREARFLPDLRDGADNFLAQAYAHLKTLPEFSDATDA